MEPITKRCVRCEQIKGVDEFHKARDRFAGRTVWCRDCKREYDRERYRTNAKVRDAVLSKQRERSKQPGFRERRRELEARRALADPEHAKARRRRAIIKYKYGLTLEAYEAILAKGCAICGDRERLNLDHDHRNGKVRAALCLGCNQTLGRFNDDPARFRAAAAYIEEWQAVHDRR